MSDSKKTKQQLIDELNALRAKMDPSGSKSAAEAEGAAGGQNITQATGLTRRDVLTAWVAPVILTVPLMPRMAAAQTGGQVKGNPTQFPTQFPTQSPALTATPTTVQPTVGQTPATVQPTPEPTPRPTPIATQPPTSSPPTSPPSPFPTVTPTAVIPVELSEFKID